MGLIQKFFSRQAADNRRAKYVDKQLKDNALHLERNMKKYKIRYPYKPMYIPIEGIESSDIKTMEGYLQLHKACEARNFKIAKGDFVFPIVSGEDKWWRDGSTKIENNARGIIISFNKPYSESPDFGIIPNTAVKGPQPAANHSLN